MRIQEIRVEEFKSDWRQALRGRENSPLQKDPDSNAIEFDPEDKIEVVSPTNTQIKKSKSVVSSRSKDSNNEIGSTVNKENKELMTKIIDQGKQLGYNAQIISDNKSPKNYGIVTSSNSNGIPIDISFGTGSGKLPDKIRLRITGSKNAEQKRLEIYRSLIEKYNLPSYVFDGTKKEDKRYLRDGIAPSLSLKGMGVSGIDGISDRFWDIVEFIDSMGSSFDVPVARSSGRAGGARSMLPQSKSSRMYYQKLTYNLIDTWHSGQPWALSRGGEGDAFDQYDSLITIGFTKDGYKISGGSIQSGPGYQREHVVPCDYINVLGIKVCEENIGPYKKMRPDKVREKFPELYNKTVREVADIIQRNLAIVICSKEESDLIDYKMGWQTTMPEGWKDGDNILDRFIKSNISVFAKSSGKRLAEEDI